MPRFASIILATVAVALLVAGCKSDPAPTPSPTAEPTPTLAISTPTPTPGPPPVGTLRVAVIGASPHRDVQRVVSEWATLLGASLGYSRLMRFEVGADTDLPSQRVVCGLCESWRVVDATTYEFDVHPQARWQDAEGFASRAVTPQDVVFSLERLREPGSLHVALLDSVDAIVPAGERTVRFTLRYPDPDLLVKLASPYAVVLAPDSIGGLDLRTSRVVGSGPWRFVQGLSGQVTLTAWEGYHRDGEPVLRGVRFHPAADLATGVGLLRAGRVDMAQITEPQWASLQSEGYRSVVIDRQGRGVVFGINAREAPFDDVRVRRAVFAALDPRAALEGSFGIGRVSTGVPVLEASWLVPEVRLAEAFTGTAAAVAVLSEAGVSAPAVTLTIANFGEEHAAHGELLAGQLRAAGFDVTTEFVSRGTYLDRVWQRRDYQLFVGPLPPTDTTNAFLLALLHSRGASNVTGAADAALDALIEEQAVELDPARRGELVREAQRMMLDGAWMFIAAGSAERWAHTERVVTPPQAWPSGAGDWWARAAVEEDLPRSVSE